MRSPGRHWRRASRWLRAVVIVLASLWLLSQVALNCGLLPHLVSAHDGRFRVSWSSAWMTWPGRVHLHGVALEEHRSGASWRLEIDTATTWVGLWSLWRRELVLVEPAVEGVRLWLRPVATTVPALALPLLLPPPPGEPIVGWEAVENPGGRPPWTLAFRGARARRLEELWLGPYRFLVEQGELRVSGRFQSGRLLEFDELALSGVVGEVWRGTQRRGARLIDGEVGGRLSAHRGSRGMTLDVVAGLDADGSFGLVVEDLGFLLFALDPGVLPTRDISGGAGEAHLEARIRKGRLRPGTRLEAHGQAVRWALPQGQLQGSYDLWAQVFPVGDGRGATELLFQVLDARLVSPGSEVLVSAPRFELRGEALLGARVGQPPDTRWLALRLEEPARVSLVALNPWLGGLVRFRSGEASLRFDLAWGERLTSNPAVGSQELEVSAPAFSFVIGETPVEASLTARLAQAPRRLAPGRLDFRRLDVSLRKVSLWDGQRPVILGWNAKLALSDAQLVANPPRLTGRLSGTLRDASPVVHLLIESGDVPRILGGLLHAENLRMSARIRATPDAILLRDIDLEGGGIGAKGRLLARDGRTPEATLLVRMGLVTGGVGIGEEGFHLQLLHPYSWFRKELEKAAPTRGTGGSGEE